MISYQPTLKSVLNSVAANELSPKLISNIFGVSFWRKKSDLKMEAIERVRASVQLRREKLGPQVALMLLVFASFFLVGLNERSGTLAVGVKEVSPLFLNKSRRYCDPPNMTALSIYFDFDSSEVLDNVDYDISQIQEMDFKVSLKHDEFKEMWLKIWFQMGTISSPIYASQMAAAVGAKRVFQNSLFFLGTLTILVPAAWLSTGHLVIRGLQGGFYAAMLPAGHMLAVEHLPPSKRNIFVALYSGFYLGQAAAEVITHPIIDIMGRDAVSYCVACLTFLGYLLLVVCVPNSTKLNPNSNIKKERKITPVPWLSFFRSRVAWMSILVVFGAHVGRTTADFAMFYYLKLVYHSTNPTLRAGAGLLHVVFAFMCAEVARQIYLTKVVSKTTCRRLFVYTSHFLVASCIFLLGYVGCNVLTPSALYAAAVIVNGAVYVGSYGSALDIAPRFAGPIFALCCTFGGIGDFVVIALVNELMAGRVRGSWRLTFGVSTLLLFASSIFFMLRGSGSVQPWNSLPSESGPTLIIPKAVCETAMGSKSDVTKTKQKLTVENKILKVLHVQDPEKFTRDRAYSASSQYAFVLVKGRPKSTATAQKKRASIS